MMKPEEYMFTSGTADPLKSAADRRVTALTPLQQAIDDGKRLGKLALYFGCWGTAKGHYLVDGQGRSLWDPTRYATSSRVPTKPKDLPWSPGLMDTGLLKNGEVLDTPTGKVYWTCGGKDAFWYAFYWWDRSVDSRGNSNSGFYVRGFGWPCAQEAFDYACSAFPAIVTRQKFPLVVQYRTVKEGNVTWGREDTESEMLCARVQEGPKEVTGVPSTVLNIVDDRNDNPDYAAWKDI